MQETILHAEPRNETGKGPAKRLRAAGRIPAVIYGHNDPLSISLEMKEFTKAFHTVSESAIITLHVGKKDVDVLIKDYDDDILTGRVQHIDFFEIERGKKLRTHVTIVIEGTSPGVREGGIVEHSLYNVEIECLPKDIPEHITVDISKIGLGESVHVANIVVPAGVRILNPAEQTVLVVAAPKAVVEPTADDEEIADASEGVGSPEAD